MRQIHKMPLWITTISCNTIPRLNPSLFDSDVHRKCINKLVRLEVVDGAIKQFWNGKKVMPNLKIVNLENLHYLTTFPDVSGAPNIEELFVCNCKKLVKFHKSLGSHKRISRLKVIGCERLKCLPSRFEMESLTFLSLRGSSVERFPDVSGAPNIEELEVGYCKNLVEFHKSLGSHKRIYRLEVTDCKRLKSLPPCFEMESLKTLSVNRCSSLERFPDLSPCMVKLSLIELDCCSSIEGLLSSLGYLSSLEYLNLRRDGSLMEYPEKHGYRENLVEDDTKALESQSKSISLQSLRYLQVNCRPMESELFLKNLQSFSNLEELDLSGNNNLIQLPATISHLSFLKFLYLNECHQLQILQGLPSSIERLHANNCYSLEKIDDLSTEEYDRWYDISFSNCEKLLKDDDSNRYLEKMLQQSFFKRCVVIDFDISIGIAGNKIPRWFKEEEAGCEIRVMIPPNCNKQIKGIAICVVFPPVECQGTYYDPLVSIKFRKVDGVSFPQNQSHIPDSVSDSVLAGEKGNALLIYRPTSSNWPFQHEDWSEGGTLLISIDPYMGAKPIRCAAGVIYKDGLCELKDFWG